MSTENVLHIDHLTMRFGGVVAVNDLSMDINKGEIVALIGPNGAGKTTAFNMVTGVYTPTEGKVVLDGHDITGKRPDEITKLGVARTFQNIRLFSSMTVFENVLTARHLRRTSNFLSATFRLHMAEEKRMRAETEAPPACPTASRGCWRSPGRCPPSRSCCCWTSPPPA